MTLDGKDLNREQEEERKTEEKRLEEQIHQMTEEEKVPESLKPENIEKLLGKQKSKKIFHWRPVYAVAAAACCVVIIGLAALGGVLQRNIRSTDGQPVLADSTKEKKKESAVSADGGIVLAKDYDEVYKYIEAERSTNQKNDSSEKSTGGRFGFGSTGAGNSESARSTESAKSTRGADTGGQAAADQSLSTPYSDTNIREEGVGEGDIVKTDGKNLYILSGQRVQIVNIEKKEMKQMASIRLGGDRNVSEIYVQDGKLILVYTRMEYDDGKERYGGNYREYTVAETYDVSNPSNPKSVGKIAQSGSFYTMRVSGEYVYLLSSFYANTSAGRTDIETYIPQVQGKSIDSSDILLPPYIRGSQYTVISTFSLKEPREKLDSKAVFGSAGLVYVSKDNIYVCEAYYDTGKSDVTQTCIRKVTYKKGGLQAIGQVRIGGTLNDSFSIDEYKGNLRLVTTVRNTGTGSGFAILRFGNGVTEGGRTPRDSNSLYILDGKLNELAKIEGLAKDESVYSARFMGDTAYFVTYRQMDPLFSVDLSNPQRPKILGELKIPGFSDYLHPYGDGLLLGVGMDVDDTGTTTQGVKLSMFDISNPKDVKEVQKFVLEDYYSTGISNNYKAAFIDKDKNLIGFSANGQTQSYYLFSYDKEKGFQEVFERELNGYSEARGLYSGEMFYIVAGNTVESYDLDTFEKIDDVVL
ncbi:beta-propeller domain-containing protein [Clostridium sp. C105KSO13]|uniref:beta-propeller domain-containing protein n=1 Tax=Clostridium sp. C105KSO13 TaxID=1776045 RepID=UPI0007405D61|nr:beta-propeller domain-containing protein [Clostridium sp. C105KSO13]CUX37341.1 Beta propeller domain protein [Clostridium sp. C105KSO13]